MRAGGSKNKGSGFEREICHELSLWISHGKRDDLFWRSSNSGGRATVVFKRGGENRTQNGDIMAIHSDGEPLTDRYLISCKFYRDLKVEGTVLGNKGGLREFWAECVEEAKRYNKLPILIAKQNNTKPFICLNDASVGLFKVTMKFIAMLPSPDGGFSILWLDTFLQHAVRPGITSTRPRIHVR